MIRTSLASFQRAAAELGATAHVDDVYTQLASAHDASKRALHTLGYVAESLGVLDELRGALGRPAEVEVALWFRDVVVPTGVFSNAVSRSADEAYAACLRMGVREPVARRVATLVRLTESHDLADVGLDPSDDDAKAMRDLDLVVLAREPIAYAELERDLRAEHTWVPLEGVYRIGRARALERLRRGGLYASERFRDRFEARARRNLDLTLRELRAKDDEPRLHATDELVYRTRAGRLVDARPWADLKVVMFAPSSPSGRGGLFDLSFDITDLTPRAVTELEPGADEVVLRLRHLPNYDHAAERRAKERGAVELVYVKEMAGPVLAPVKLPPPPRVVDGPYR